MRFALLSMRCQCFMRIFLRFSEAGLNVVTKGKMVLDVFGLVSKAAFLDENFISAIMFLTSFQG